MTHYSAISGSRDSLHATSSCYIRQGRQNRSKRTTIIRRRRSRDTESPKPCKSTNTTACKLLHSTYGISAPKETSRTAALASKLSQPRCTVPWQREPHCAHNEHELSRGPSPQRPLGADVLQGPGAGEGQDGSSAPSAGMPCIAASSASIAACTCGVSSWC